MSYLIDTNVISELRKGDRCDPAVAAWWAKVDEDELWTSALVLGEIRRGIELARRRDPQKAKALEAWLEEVISGFGDRVHFLSSMPYLPPPQELMASSLSPETERMCRALASTSSILSQTEKVRPHHHAMSASRCGRQ